MKEKHKLNWNNINLSLIPINKNIKSDYLNIRINHLSKKTQSNSKRNIFQKDNSKRDLFHNKSSNKINNIKITSKEKEKKEHSYSNLNSKFENNINNINNINNSKFHNDDFFKYLKSIGLGDMYKLCMPNYLENNLLKNYNNRYIFGKKGNYLPNINNVNGNFTNKNTKNEINKDNYNKNKIIPNKRLVPINNKII